VSVLDLSSGTLPPGRKQAAIYFILADLKIGSKSYLISMVFFPRFMMKL